MGQLKEVAKFGCGFEAFHALMHGYLWCFGITISVLGISTTPTLNIAGTLIASVISVSLGCYGWKTRQIAIYRPRQSS